jgi:ABC-type branched-subunit amino acid transport system substrate-binding protein
MRKSTALLAHTAMAAGLLALLPAGAAAEPAEVKVALVVPLSGPWARQGLLEREGAEMAIEDINAAGGIKSLGGAKLKLIIGDTGDTVEKAKNAAQRLVAQEPDLVGGVGAWLSSFTLAVTEVTERAEIPWLTLSYSDQRAASTTSSRHRPPAAGRRSSRCRPSSRWRNRRMRKSPPPPRSSWTTPRRR